MYADYHVHTEFSFDSNYSIEQIVKDAINMGLEEICFTDHVDYGVCIEYDEPIEKAFVHKGMPFINVNYPKYFHTIEELQNKYKGQIIIKKGLEFGMQVHTIPDYEKLFKTYLMDFVIMSIHEIHDKDIAFKEHWQNFNSVYRHREYYENMLKIIKDYKNYSVIGHLDYPQRYDPRGKCPLKEFEDLIYEILKQVIKDDKGIEVNMASVRYNIGDLTPSKQILKMYYELGGRIITVGTDSHKPEHLGRYIEDGKAQLKEIGFKEFCTFENMKPIYHKL